MSSTQPSVVKEAAEISVNIMRALVDQISVYNSPAKLNIRMAELCATYGVVPAFKGVPGTHAPFNYNLCISVNNQVLHGVPSSKTPFETGDLVKIDLGIIYRGQYTDHCVTVGINKLSAENEKLIKIGKESVYTAAKKAVAGAHVGDLSATMQTYAELAGFNVLKDYVGHGIGHKLWLPPEIPAFGLVGKGPILQAGQIICVEAQLVAGSDQVYIDSDGWTVVTKDHKPGVMFEFMVMVGVNNAEILTPTQNWDLIVKV